MPKKTKILFISTFLIVVAIIVFFLFFNKIKTKNPNNEGATNNQPFDPFQTGNENINTNTENIIPPEKTVAWTDNTSNQTSKFNQITDFAIAGADFFEDKKIITEENKEVEKNIPSIKYIEKTTGHIYQMPLDTRSATKISNSTIPGAHEVLINDLSDTFIYRYLSPIDKTITSFVATLGESKGEFLPSNILEIDLSPDKTNMFYLVKNTNGVLGFIKSFNQTKKTQVFSSPFTEWLPQLISNQSIFLTTKPSWMASGSLFNLNTKTGTLSKLFGGVAGLTTLANKDGSKVLYGASLSIGPKLWLLDVKEHTTKDLDTYGLPEKCIWSKDNINIYCASPNTIIGTQHPDSWYQGLISFDDYFVKINTQTSQRSTFANSINEIPIDAINLFLDKEESTLFFTNKKDSTLWSLDL